MKQLISYITDYTNYFRNTTQVIHMDYHVKSNGVTVINLVSSAMKKLPFLSRTKAKKVRCLIKTYYMY